MRHESQYKKQHWVPDSYMKPWADSSAREPFIWIFEKEDDKGQRPIRRAPKNFFHKTDLYTRFLSGGRRDVSLELFFSSVEKSFNRSRRDVILRGELIDDECKLNIAAFVAIQALRTPRSRDHHVAQTSTLIDHIEKTERAVARMTDEQRRKLTNVRTLASGPSLTKQDLLELREQPFHAIGLPLIRTMLDILPRMCLTIIVTTDTRGFITSDTPVATYDPTAYRRSPVYRSPGLAHKSVEVTMPISPNALCLFHWKDSPDGYCEPEGEAAKGLLDEHNRRIRFMCGEHFVVNCSEVDPYWFKEFPLPDDAWELTHQVNRDPEDMERVEE